MSTYPGQQPSLEVNELAKERNRKAAERTLAAWIQACLTLMGSGIAVEQVVRNLNHFFPHDFQQGLASLLGLNAIALSGVLLVFATLEHALSLRAIAKGHSFSQPYRLRAVFTVGSVLLLGLSAFYLIVLVPR